MQRLVPEQDVEMEDTTRAQPGTGTPQPKPMKKAARRKEESSEKKRQAARGAADLDRSIERMRARENDDISTRQLGLSVTDATERSVERSQWTTTVWTISGLSGGRVISCRRDIEREV